MLAWLALWAIGSDGSTDARPQQLCNSSGTPSPAIGSVVGIARCGQPVPLVRIPHTSTIRTMLNIQSAGPEHASQLDGSSDGVLIPGLAC